MRASLAVTLLLAHANCAVALDDCVDFRDQRRLSDGRPEAQPIRLPDLVSLRDLAGASLSPDGSLVAFQVREPRIASNDYVLDWYVAEVDDPGCPRAIGSGGQAMLHLYPDGRSSGALAAPDFAWSPDGRRGAFRARNGAEVQVWLWRRSGGLARQATRGKANVQRFSWHESGRSIFLELDADRDIIATANRAEAQRGYYFDDRFAPYYAPHPLDRRGSLFGDGGRVPVSHAMHVLDVARGTVREPTAEESARISWRRVESAGAHRSSAGMFRVAPTGARAWLMADPAGQDRRPAPLTLFADSQQASAVRCPSAQCQGAIEDIWWTSDSSRVVYSRRAGTGRGLTEIFVWDVGSGAVTRSLSTPDLLSGCAARMNDLVCVHASPDQPPRLVRVDLSDGSLHVIADPNPQYGSLRLAAAERIEWKDAHGTGTFGYLFKPRDFSPMRRYPLIVVQYRARGFRPGGTGNEYPIQGFVAAGMAVLLFERPTDWHLHDTETDPMEIERQGWRQLRDRRMVLASLEAGIDLLAERGIVDPARVGITGLSDGAETAYFALIHSNRFAVAAVSGPSAERANYYLFPPDAQALFETWGLGQERSAEHWAEISVAENACRIFAPILINASDREYLRGLPAFWRLREAGRPVEMFVYPDEHHQKWQPVHRLHIYQRNVDWFRFWLLGEENGMASDAGQYARWKDLRSRWLALREHDGPPAGEPDRACVNEARAARVQAPGSS
jgi:dipeptidyl aminopeptidase/acylaminoacyl peptidase